MLKNNLITVIIRTIGRNTLKNAIESSKKEFNKVIVVADAIDLDKRDIPSDVLLLKTGQKFDKYGSAAINMGAYACDTEYFCLLDDDDEFIQGAGDYMIKKISSEPDIDVWIPGIKYNDGLELCLNSNRGITLGNIAVPTYKTHLLFVLPFFKALSGNNSDYIDFHHVELLGKMGYKIKWYEKLLYSVRPKLDGRNGRGK
jgi:hypothetical protein